MIQEFDWHVTPSQVFWFAILIAFLIAERRAYKKHQKKG